MIGRERWNEYRKVSIWRTYRIEQKQEGKVPIELACMLYNLVLLFILISTGKSFKKELIPESLDSAHP